MNVTELISDFGQQIGIPELALNDDGGCCLSFDEVELDFEYSEERSEFLITSPLGRLPDGFDAQLILAANFHNALTGPGSLGWNQSTERLSFMHRLGIENLDGTGLELALREILDRILFWTEWLKKTPASSATSDDPIQSESAIRI